MLYHITFVRNLDGIAQHGLRPGHGKNFWNYLYYARDNTFFTTYEGVECWFAKIMIAGEDTYKEKAVEQGAFPVALRLRDAAIELILDDIIDDREGNQDCPDGESFYCTETIPPHWLDVWDGRAWRPLEQGIGDDIMARAKQMAKRSTMGGYVYLELPIQTFRPRTAVTYRAITLQKPADEYYHGTKSEKAARGIMECGIVPPNVSERKRRMLCPLQGRVYLTKDLRMAIIYALGGIFLGEAMSKEYIGQDHYGYVFVVAGADLDRDVVLDEDIIGEMISKQRFDWLNYLAVRYLTPRQLHKVMDGEYNYWAQAGKKLMPYIRPQQMQQLLDVGANIAHEGPVKPKSCWRIDKRRSMELKSDGSNFFEIAEQC